LGKLNYERGHEELSPYKTATELLKGPKVAITTRFTKNNHSSVLAYKEALESRGAQVRIVSDNHTAMEDFCFLRHANHLVGQDQSTFSFWAGLLGDGNRTRIYAVKSRRTRHSIKFDRLAYKWTHPKLKGRIEYEVFNSEEMDDYKAGRGEEHEKLRNEGMENVFGKIRTTRAKLVGIE
jgi:hypothetical protein